MTIDQIRKHHRALPFRPFRIHLADGRALDVSHPEMLAIMPPGRTVFVATGHEDYEIVDLHLVTSLETTNGSEKRPRKKG
jgi:hypothetical protein